MKQLTDIEVTSSAPLGTGTSQGYQITSIYSYDGVSSRRRSITYTNGTSVEYTYDALNRIKSLKNKASGGAIFSSFDYTYDKVGNRRTMTSNEGLHNYYYDKTYQLIDVTYPDLRTGHYEYDSMGNRVYVDDKGEHLDYALKANGLNQYDYISKTSHNIDIEGTVGANNPTVTVNSVDAIVSGEVFMAEDVTLSEGINLILAEAKIQQVQLLNYSVCSYMIHDSGAVLMPNLDLSPIS